MTPRKSQRIAASSKGKGMTREEAPIVVKSTNGSSTRTTPDVPEPFR